MRPRLYLIMFVISATLLVIKASFSQTMPGCIPPAAMEIHVGKLVPDALEKRIEGQNAMNFLGALNTLNTTTTFVGDLVLVFISRQLPGVGVTIFKEGCLVAQETFKPLIFRRLLAQAGIVGEDM